MAPARLRVYGEGMTTRGTKAPWALVRMMSALEDAHYIGPYGEPAGQ